MSEHNQSFYKMAEELGEHLEVKRQIKESQAIILDHTLEWNETNMIFREYRSEDPPSVEEIIDQLGEGIVLFQEVSDELGHIETRQLAAKGDYGEVFDQTLRAYEMLQIQKSLVNGTHDLVYEVLGHERFNGHITMVFDDLQKDKTMTLNAKLAKAEETGQFVKGINTILDTPIYTMDLT